VLLLERKAKEATHCSCVVDSCVEKRDGIDRKDRFLRALEVRLGSPDVHKVGVWCRVTKTGGAGGGG